MTEFIRLKPGDKVVHYDGADLDEGCEIVSIEELSASLGFIKYSYCGRDKVSIRSFLYKMPDEKERLLDEIEETMGIADWHRQTISANY